MAVLGFDLAPFRSAISELQQGVRAGVQEQQAGTGGDYLGYLSGLAPPSQSPAWQALGQAGQHIAPALGGGPSLDFLGQLTAYANQNSGGNSPAFGLLSSISQYGLGAGQAALGGLQKTWNDLSAYGDRLAYNAQQAAASSGQNTGPGSYPKPGPAPSAAPTGGRGTPGAGFGNPTADQVEGLLTGTRLAGQGQAIVQLAQQYGVPVALAMGILKAESSYSTPAGGTVNNFGGLKNADGSGGFADFPDVRSGLEAVIRNMGSDIYHGLSLQDYLNKYLGGYQGGDPEQYYGNVTSVIRALGGTPDYGSVPVGAPQQGGATVPGGAGMLAGAWAFPVVGYSGQVQTHWGTGETGASDIMAAGGTPIVAMHGGKVIDASYNNYGGNTVTIQDEQGRQYYYAHMQGPAGVQAGQLVQAGAALGLVGNTGDAAGGPTHLHIGITAPGTDIKAGKDAQGGAGYAWGSGPQDNAVGLLTWVLNGGR